MVYLDYSATTKADKQVLDTYQQVEEKFWGNANSHHRLGVDARKLIDASTKQIKEILHLQGKEIIYTSGATEANNLVIKGVCLKSKNRGRHIITTELEHSSVLETIAYLVKEYDFTVDYVKLDQNGQVDLSSLKKLMREDTVLVSIASINSEIGIRQPLAEISNIVRKNKKTYFHSDVTQSMGKEIIDFSVLDFASFSAQKFFGMKGIGGLIKNENVMIEPLIHGGKSTTSFRSGTPATSLIVSTAKALRLCYENFQQKQKHVQEIHDYLINHLKMLKVDINSNDYCIPHIVNISLKNAKPETMLHALEQEEIYISTKTACSTNESSTAVFALTKEERKAKKSLRISLSYLTTKEEIDYFIEVFTKNLQKLEELGK